ncbi:NAC domain-containing protein 62-like [Populus alba x Populus x berolinensis]|uniref:NAC domain-containing protein 62-like n=1 Tax=Populus alba x Populus x berolinensis TaxID=444605 RepID=A0AAD6RFU7_9ROSI|nr:NAC domain-containing protein 62-like [Populus alba x Populus x berolinensis]
MAPVGYRFHPTEEEIIRYYLKHKMDGRDFLVDDLIGEVDLYRRDPWELPDSARIKSDDDRVWYYFCRLDYKHSNSKRARRETKNGYWKSTGNVRDIKARRTDEVIGTKRTLVFQHRCPDSKKVVGTSWVIHEFLAKTSTPDQRPLVLCKLKDKADDPAANLPDDEGEPIRVMGSNVENNAVLNNNQEVDAALLQSLIDSHGAGFDSPSALQSQNHVQNINQEVDAALLQSLIDSHGAGFDSPFALQSQNHVQNINQEVDAALLQSLIDSHGAGFDSPFALQSQNHVQNINQEVDAALLQSFIDSQGAGFDFPLALQPHNLVQNYLSDEEDIDFADSLLNDYIPPTPRSSSNAYVLDSSDRETYPAYGESPNLFGGHGSSRAYRRKQMAHCDDTLLMGASSMDSTTVTRHEQVNSGFPRIHKAQKAQIPNNFLEQEGISAKGDQLRGGFSSTASKHKAREGARQAANIDLPKKVAIESLDAEQLQSLFDSHGAGFNNNQELDAEQLQSLFDSHGAGFDNNQELDAEQLQSLFDSHGAGFNNNQQLDAEQLQSLFDSHGAGFDNNQEVRWSIFYSNF